MAQIINIIIIILIYILEKVLKLWICKVVDCQSGPEWLKMQVGEELLSKNANYT